MMAAVIILATNKEKEPTEAERDEVSSQILGRKDRE